MTREEWSVLQNTYRNLGHLIKRIQHPSWRNRFADDHSEWLYLRDILRPTLSETSELWHLFPDPDADTSHREYAPPVQLDLFDHHTDTPESWDHY